MPWRREGAFDFNGPAFCVTEIDGVAWFVSADACRSLGLKPHKTNGGFANHFRRLDDEERQPTPIEGRVMTVASEAGLYKLISRSKKPEARAFDRWVRHVVHPAIRQDNMCVMGKQNVETEEYLMALSLPQPTSNSTVVHAVVHAVPVDLGLTLAVPLVLLRPRVEAMPAAGT